MRSKLWSTMSSQLSYRLHGREQRPKTLHKHHRDELDTGHKSGNPAGRPKRQITNLAAEARKHSAECIEMLLSIMRGTVCPHPYPTGAARRSRGVTPLIEFLGDGQQFVAAGRHPD